MRGKGVLGKEAKFARMVQYAKELGLKLPVSVVEANKPKITVRMLLRERRRLLELLSVEGRAVVTANPQGTIRVHTYDGYQTYRENGKRHGWGAQAAQAEPVSAQ